MRRAAGLTATLAMVASLATGVMPASAAAVSVLNGGTYRTMPFPNDALTVPDATQLTGRHVNFRVGPDYPACDGSNYSTCDVYRQLNRLDGFDIQPRVTIPFSGAIDIKSVNDTDFFIQGPGGRTGIVQLVWDPAGKTLSGLSNGLLHEASTYNLVVTSFITDSAGNPVDACGGACIVPFTTMTATAQLDHIRRSLDNGSAFAAAGLGSPASRKLGFTQGGTDDVFLAASVPPSVSGPADGILRHDQTSADPAKPLTDTVAPVLVPPGNAGYYAFGSFQSPRYQYRAAGQDDANGFTDGEIPMLPSTQTQQPFGADRIGVTMILPVGTPPAGGWPVAIYGPGFTRSKFDLFVTSDFNATLGIATIATDPAGHSYGPNSTVTVKHDLTSTTFLDYGRGRNVNGDGLICDGLKDGVGPTEHVTTVDAAKACSDNGGNGQEARDLAANPSHKPVDGVRSGLIQTVIDNMALARSIALGAVVPVVPTNAGDVLSKTDISYYGLSFGGIYGTMLMGTDPMIHKGLLNVPGGPIVDIARLSTFRHNIADTLKWGKPDIRNGGPGINGFTESIPLRGDPSMTSPRPGAIPLQELFGQTNWYDRSGSPESFTPLIRDRPLAGAAAKTVLFQTALGDGTVPNPTAGNIYRNGNLFDVVTYYRNDRSATAVAQQSNPHGWLADPTIDPAARSAGETQLSVFLKTGQITNPNPALLEVPINNKSNLSCLHYPNPETGQPFSVTANAPDCPALAIDDHIWLDPLPLAAVTQQARQFLETGGHLPSTVAGRGGALASALLMLLIVGLGSTAAGAFRRLRA